MGSGSCDVLIIGGGPAGLRAAEIVSASGKSTLLADHKPSVGRKFLVAGRGGLNLTHSEPVEHFPARYGTDSERWESLLADFSPADLCAWVEGLGIETFVGTSGRVFPTHKQAAPLLRRWIERLRKQGVSFRARHRLTGFQRKGNSWEVSFNTAEGTVALEARALVLACGGASWPQTGSDGSWVKLLTDAGIDITPLTPANCGYEIAWPEALLAEAEGKPLKNISVRAGEQSVTGELLITKEGLEGGAIYQLGRTLRAMAHPRLEIDLKPTFTVEQLMTKLGSAKGTEGIFRHAVQAWHLSPAAAALLKGQGPIEGKAELAMRAKAIPLTLLGPRPIEEAISTAGGVKWDELDEHLMLKKLPGLFCAGEMIDWDAPTGGYLLQGCMATATRAAQGVLRLI